MHRARLSTYLLELRVSCFVARVLVCVVSAPIRLLLGKIRVVTGMQLDRKFAVRLLDFEFSRGGRDAQGIVVCSLYHHFIALTM